MKMHLRRTLVLLTILDSGYQMLRSNCESSGNGRIKNFCEEVHGTT